MAEYNFPWQGRTTGKAGPYTDSLYARMMRDLFNAFLRPNAGVVPDTGDGVNASLDVQQTAVASTSVRIRPGSAFVIGRWYMTDDDIVLPITANGSGFTRKDLVVLRSNSSTQIITPFIIDGTPSGSPAIPSPVQAGSIWDIPLAVITVSSPFASIVTADIDNSDDIREWYTVHPIKMGGTGLDEVALGDVLVASAANTLSLQNLADGQTLVRDLSQGDSFNSRFLGVERIAGPTTLGASATTIALNSIPAKYQDLLLIVQARSTAAGSEVRVTLNADSGANYSKNSTTISAAGAEAHSVLYDQASVACTDTCAPSTATASHFGYLNFRIGGYAKAISRGGDYIGNRFSSAALHARSEGTWAWENVANAITSIELALNAGDFEVGTQYTLYGIGRNS